MGRHGAARDRRRRPEPPADRRPVPPAPVRHRDEAGQRRDEAVGRFPAEPHGQAGRVPADDQGERARQEPDRVPEERPAPRAGLLLLEGRSDHAVHVAPKRHDRATGGRREAAALTAR